MDLLAGLPTAMSGTWSTLGPVQDEYKSTTNSSSLDCEFQAVRGLILIPFALITIFSVPGNLLVMLSIHREKRLQNPTNAFVTGLAVADVINGLLCIPSAYFWFVSYCNNFVVLYFRFIIRTCCGCSVVHLVLVSIDRYVAVSKPLEYQSLITRNRAQKSSAIAWTVIVLYMLVNAVLYNLNMAFKSVNLNSVAFVIFWNYLPSSMIVVAMILTSVIYAYVFYQARQLRCRMTSMMRNHAPSSVRTSRRSKQLKATKTLAIVVLAFAICWLPISMTIFIDVKAPGYDPVISLGPTLLYLSNSVMNPLIFAYRSRDFREAYKSVIRDALRCSSSTVPIIRRSSRPSDIEDPISHQRSNEYPAVTNATNAVV